MTQLVGQVEEDISGVRVYATPGGCSGINFGMTFTDQVNADVSVLQFKGFDLVIDHNAMQYLQGEEIDYLDHGDAASFVFNNLQSVGGGCGTCGSSQGGGCA